VLLLAAVSILVIASCDDRDLKTDPIVDSESVPIVLDPMDSSGGQSVFGTVFEKQNRTHIPAAIVYVGATGTTRVQTDAMGRYRIPIKTHGSYALFVYKKGYRRMKQNFKVQPQCEIEVNFELKRLRHHLQAVQRTGEVVLIVTAQGTRSESRWFELRTDDGQSAVLFDMIGISSETEFEKWLGETVVVTGYSNKGYVAGYVDWDYEPIQGIYVERIEQSP
jgi:hypothetical protein